MINGQMRPSLNVLLEISLYLPKLKHWVRLAENLGLREDFIMRVRAGRIADDVVALKVLYKWREEKKSSATGRALFDALVATSKAVALHFAERLLGEGEKMQ